MTIRLKRRFQKKVKSGRAFFSTSVLALIASAGLTQTMAFAEIEPPKERIITTSNVLTQVVVALGKEAELVGVDTTSRTTPSLKKLPDVGYRLALSTEGILSLKPTLILIAEGAGPQNVLDQVARSKVPQLMIDELNSVEDIVAMTEKISTALGETSRGEQLATAGEISAEQLQSVVAKRPNYRGYFIMQEAGGKGSVSISGRDTSADKMLALLGVQNLFSSDFNNYKSVSIEGQMEKRPDLVFIGSRRDFASESFDQIAPFKHLSKGMKEWPAKLQPKCVFELDMSRYLVYGIHIFDEVLALREAVDACMTEAK
ncbi:MAG: ABC transporter substrate-binding protein [Xanthomonadaceae bacterium]|nr:ABC transporter substrate-binding protein [Xanthomonadaceae bacterium]